MNSQKMQTEQGSGWENGKQVPTEEHKAFKSSSSSEDVERIIWDSMVMQSVMQLLTDTQPTTWTARLAAMSYHCRVTGFETIGAAAQRAKVSEKTIMRHAQDLEENPYVREKIERLTVAFNHLRKNGL